MATTISTTYAGEASAAFVSAALLEGKTLANENVTLVDGIKYKMAVQKLDMSNLLQRGGCDFNDSGDLAITEAILEPKPFKVNKKECVTTFLPHWYSAKMRAGANNSDMTPFNQFIIEQIGKNIAKDVETLIWQAKYVSTGTTTSTAFDGFLWTLKNGSAIDLTGSTLTKTNIISNGFERAYNAIPSAIMSRGNVKFYANRKMIGFYLQNLAAQGDRTTESEGMIQYLDIPILETPGLPDNIILAAEPSNLMVGTDLAGDMNEISLIDRKPIDGSDNFYYIAKFTLDCAVAYTGEVVFLGENLWV